MNFILSIFNDKSDNLPQQVVRTWPQLCQRFAAPVVRQEKDGTLFSPARFTPPVRRAANVVEVSLLVLDCDHGLKQMADINKQVLSAVPGLAFAIYSTHSHRQVTKSNPLAESRYRVVVPLAAPVPVAEFAKLWQWAAAIPGLQIDQQAKDASRIYYTPAKFADEAPYEWHVERGEFLQWEKVVQSSGGKSDVDVSGIRETRSLLESNEGKDRKPPTTNPKPETGFPTWASRHEELTARIRARGKRNGRGIYDARCIAHNGKGATGLLFNPTTNAVSCNGGCSYDALLFAEGLLPGPLPDQPIVGADPRVLPDTAALDQGGQIGQDGHTGPPLQTPPTASRLHASRLHVVYSLLLAHCLELRDEDAAAIAKHWGPEAAYMNESISWPEVGQNDDGLQNKNWDRNLDNSNKHMVQSDIPLPTRSQALVKVCSLPTFNEARTAAGRLAELFDLSGIPGFYLSPVANAWCLNVPSLKPGALLSPYYSPGGYLIGIRIHRSVRDRRGGNSWLLTSRGLPRGSRAVALREVA